MRKSSLLILMILALASCAQSRSSTSVRGADRAVMVYIPGGDFTMGNDDWFDDAKPAHQVRLDAFWFDRTEVTVAQYRRCVEAGNCTAPASGGEVWVYNREYDARPVTDVDWHQASVYCSWVGARLPTEAEWEYAARGPEGRIYPWGNDWDAERVALQHLDDPVFKPENVGSHPNGASWCGALDLAGNVMEWVEDWYGPYPGEPQVNPQGSLAGDTKAARGGSFLSGYNQVRSDHRAHGIPSVTSLRIGFRCAKSP